MNRDVKTMQDILAHVKTYPEKYREIATEMCTITDLLTHSIELNAMHMEEIHNLKKQIKRLEKNK